MDSIQVAGPSGRGHGLARYRYAYTGLNPVTRKGDLFFTNTLSAVSAIRALTQFVSSLKIDTQTTSKLLTDRGSGSADKHTHPLSVTLFQLTPRVPEFLSKQFQAYAKEKGIESYFSNYANASKVCVCAELKTDKKHSCF